MSPQLLRLVSAVSLALALGLATLWLLEEAQILTLLDNPEIGALALGLLGMTTGLIARNRSDSETDAETD